MTESRSLKLERTQLVYSEVFFATYFLRSLDSEQTQPSLSTTITSAAQITEHRADKRRHRSAIAGKDTPGEASRLKSTFLEAHATGLAAAESDSASASPPHDVGRAHPPLHIAERSLDSPTTLISSSDLTNMADFQGNADPTTFAEA